MQRDFCFFKAHPTKQYFAVGEKGKKPNLIIYDYPSLRPYRILRGSVKSFISIFHKWASVYRSQQMESWVTFEGNTTFWSLKAKQKTPVSSFFIIAWEETCSVEIAN